MFILSILYVIIGTNSKRYVVFLGLLDFFSNVLSLHNRKRNDFATLKNLEAPVLEHGALEKSNFKTYTLENACKG